MEWCLRWKLLKGLAVSVELLEAVFVSAWYLRWMVLAMSVDCLLLAKRLSLGLVERMEAVQVLEAPLEEQC